MLPHSPRVSILILNWNSYEVTRECLTSLGKIDYPNVDIILVDNGSADLSASKLLEEFPGLRLIKNKENLGFTGGNNVGIRNALDRGTDYLLLLNNDTVVSPSFLTELVRTGESDPQIGILSPKIYYSEPSDRLWYAGGEYRPWRSFPKALGMRERDDGRYDQTREVSFISGCALLIKANVLAQVGVLDEMFFHSFEDLDLSVRVLEAGFKAMYVPASVIWHRVSYLTDRSMRMGFIEYYITRNSLLFARKHVRFQYWPFYVLFLTAWLTKRTLECLIHADLIRVRALCNGVWSGCTMRMPARKICV